MRRNARTSKSRFKISFLLLVLLFSGRAQAWEIESFNAEIAVQKEGILQVTETIDVDFQGEERHGIYRDIPLATQDRLGVKRSIHLDFREALDEAGLPWAARITREGVYRRIRLGSSEKTYRGKKKFVISYRVERILQAFPDHDELYWNVTGNGWDVPIRRTTVQVRLPERLSSDQIRSAAYTGSYGQRGSSAQITAGAEGTLRYDLPVALQPFEGLTLVAGWPSGLVRMPGRFTRLIWFLMDNWPLGIPLAVLAGMFLIWWNFGRDPARETIPVQYEPPDHLTPAELGALVDDRVDLRDITSTIVDLARRGFLTIEELQDREYLLARKGSAETAPLKSHEALLLKFLFYDGQTVRISDLENKFYQHLPGLRTAIYQELIGQGYWWNRPDRVRMFWWGVSGMVFFFGWFAVTASPDPALSLVVLLLSSGILAAFSWFMPRKTWRGARLSERIIGFEEFLRRTDEDRLKRESHPAALFERLLPYAMALGVAKQWAIAFEGIYQVNPVWYTGCDGRSFTPGDFTRRIGSASDRMGTALVSSPRSSGGSGFGGGFSGGGGGGGGGGAW